MESNRIYDMLNAVVCGSRAGGLRHVLYVCLVHVGWDRVPLFLGRMWYLDEAQVEGGLRSTK